MTREELKEKIAKVQEQIDDFDKAEFLTEEQYDDFIDEIEGEISICGMSYCASTILKEIDPIAYRCGFSDFANSMELEDFQEYNDLVEELEDLEKDLEEMGEEDE